MTLVCFIIGLALVARWLRLPPFETVFGVLLAVPLVVFPVGLFVPAGALTYAVVLCLLGGGVLLLRERRPPAESRSAWHELESIAVFSTFYILNYALCLLWPDFIALGERLRDYALLASVEQSPIVPREPWLAGASLNYYLYWYRFGHVIGALVGLPTWELYHQLQAFTFALFGAALFHLGRRCLDVSSIVALGVAVGITYGSNVAGVVDFLAGDTNWWGPSRVVAGAINEFPAWSFLLGDLHPHFLNLALSPFLVVLVRAFAQGGIRGGAALVALLAVSPLWFFNANAWEVPVWLGFTAVGLGAFVVRYREQISSRSGRDVLVRSARDPGVWAIVAVGLYFGASLYLSSRNISPGDTPIGFVHGPIQRSNLFDLLRHWGLPLGLIATALIVALEGAAVRVVALFALGGAFLSRDPMPLLVLLIGLSAFDLYRLVESAREGGRSELGQVLVSALGLGALISMTVPEIAFLDDPYGGEHERMNTIFKIYSATWFALHLYAVALVARVTPRAWAGASPWWLRGSAAVGTLLLCGFFFQTAEVRRTRERSIVPYAQGLSEITQRFPGAGPAIQALERRPRGVVVEAQGPAYDYTTHVATLSGNAAYLGWANHVNLLTRQYAEVSRREEVTRAIYSGDDCRATRALLEREKIEYLVLGPVERRAYPGATPSRFDCLEPVISAGEYTIFALPRGGG